MRRIARTSSGGVSDSWEMPSSCCASRDSSMRLALRSHTPPPLEISRGS
jgi:hypothetical protein